MPRKNIRTKVAVMFGGASPEHEVSIISGTQLIYAIDSLKYEIFPVYVSERGDWYTGPELADKRFFVQVAKNPAVLNNCTRVMLRRTGGQAGLGLEPSYSGRLIKSRQRALLPIDVFFPVFHGGAGENGGIQGMLECAGVPYVGSGVLASAIGMNKSVCKQIAAANGIPVLPSRVIQRTEARQDLNKAIDHVLAGAGLEKFPLFVKPCNLGSSIAVSSCGDRVSLGEALVRVFKYDTEAIVEPSIQELVEINVSVMEGCPPVVSVTERPNAEAEESFLTYEDKYMRGDKLEDNSVADAGMASLPRVIDPQDVPQDLKSQAQQYAARIFTAIHAGGVVRVDFIIDNATKQLYFNEINTIPGSLAYYLWNESDPGLLYTEVIDKLITGALARFEDRKALRTTYGFKAIFKGA